MTNQVLNESVALQWCQQQYPLFLRVLASFYQQYRVYLKPVSLTAAQTQQLAHDLRSAAPGCGATGLALIANQLARPAPTPGKAAQQELLEALSEVLHCIEENYPAAIALTQNSQKNSPEELRQALEQHNLKSLALFKEWASEYAQHWPDRVVNDIQQALNSFHFDRARVLLDAALADTTTGDHNDI